MQHEERLRSSVRLRVQEGQVLLRYAGVPALACKLADLSLGGCSCQAPLGRQERQVAEAWERILARERPLELELTLPPYLDQYAIPAEVRTTQPAEGGDLRVGLRFLELAPERKRQLEQIILDMAAGKVRQAFAPERISGTAMYLVGTGTAVGPPRSVVRAEPVAPPPLPAGAPASNRPAVANPPPPPRNPTVMGPGGNVRVAGGEARAPGGGARAPSLNARAPGVLPAGVPMLTPRPSAPAAGRENPYRGKKLGEILIGMGKLSQPQVDLAVQSSRQAGMRLGKWLLREGLINAEEVCRALSLQSGLPMTAFAAACVPPRLISVFPLDLMLRHDCVPFDDSDEQVYIVAPNPLPASVVRDLERICQRKVEVFLGPEEAILRALDALRPSEKAPERGLLRRPVVLPVSYQICNRLGRLADEAHYAGRTVDVSEEGLQIEAPAPKSLTADDVRRRGLCLRLTIAWGERHVELLCDPRSIEVREQAQLPALPWRIGLRVLEITEENRRVLRELCFVVSRGHTLGPPGKALG